MNDLDEVIGAMYQSVCYEPGGHPDWKLEDEIFAPGARLVRINDEGVFEFDRESYRTNLESMIATGALPSFWEGELWRETRLFGDMAHVLSGYESRPTRSGPLLNRGVNSIQLFRRNGRWWISAMIWRREGRDVHISTSPTV
jgi:hypothetical protein